MEIFGNLRLRALLNILYTVFGEISILTGISLKLTQKYGEKVFGKYMQIRVAIQFCRKTDNKIFPISRHLQKKERSPLFYKKCLPDRGCHLQGRFFVFSVITYPVKFLMDFRYEFFAENRPQLLHFSSRYAIFIIQKKKKESANAEFYKKRDQGFICKTS